MEPFDGSASDYRPVNAMEYTQKMRPGSTYTSTLTFEAPAGAFSIIMLSGATAARTSSLGTRSPPPVSMTIRCSTMQLVVADTGTEAASRSVRARDGLAAPAILGPGLPSSNRSSQMAAGDRVGRRASSWRGRWSCAIHLVDIRLGHRAVSPPLVRVAEPEGGTGTTRRVTRDRPGERITRHAACPNLDDGVSQEDARCRDALDHAASA